MTAPNLRSGPDRRPPPVIELHDVTAWRGRTPVLDDFSLRIDAGQSTAILGPNGAGKSTLLKLLSSEVRPQYDEKSQVRFFGRERWNLWELRTRLGLVSHDLHVDYPAHVRGLDVVISGFFSSQGLWTNHPVEDRHRAAARKAMARLGVAELAERPLAAMSTGQQRRLFLARALVHEPPVLILDEPTAGLDLKACFDYLTRIEALMAEGVTVVVATHHVHEIPPGMERVVLLSEGRIVADGPKEEVLTGPLLSRAFGTAVEVVRAHGFYQVVFARP